MISFQNVTKSFGSSRALSDISFDFEPGELVYLTGHSGSGKTTLLRLITRQYTPTNGEIVVNNIPLSSIRKNKVHLYRRKIGVVFQNYLLLPEYTIWENMALPLAISGMSTQKASQRISDLLRLVELAHTASLFPHQLSGGEAQRICIARALAIAPQVLIADEPTGNLDPQTSLKIASLLKKINQLGTTVVVATHDQTVLSEHAHERILTLEKGTLVSDSRPKQDQSATPAAAVEAQPSASSPNSSPAHSSTSDTQHSSALSRFTNWFFGRSSKPPEASTPPEAAAAAAPPVSAQPVAAMPASPDTDPSHQTSTNTLH